MGVLQDLTTTNAVFDMGGFRVGTGGQDTPPPGKSQFAICFLRNTGKEPLETQLDPSHRVQLLLERGMYDPL